MLTIDQKLLLENKAWVQEKLVEDSHYFKRLCKGQSPKVVWVGCSDSRVPVNEITNTEPGEVFVHRNVANQAYTTDANIASVLEYAVFYLNVEHIVICGHYDCGGVKAALDNLELKDGLSTWLKPLYGIRKANIENIESIQDKTKKLNKLVELNVLYQIEHIHESRIIQEAKRQNKNLMIHGWIFDMTTGLLKELTKQSILQPQPNNISTAHATR